MRRGVMILAAVVAITLGACEQETDSKHVVAVDFRKDGVLTFHRTDANPLTIDVEIADSDSARVRGMMQRSEIPSGSGMLFVFPTSRIQSFWMANTPLSLDIMFVDSDSTIVDIARYTTPLSTENVTSSRPARFVVEVPAGFSDTHGIIESNKITWTRTPG